MGPLTILPLAGIPEVREGDDLGELIARAAWTAGTPLQDGDCLVVTQKVVSKAEGRIVAAESREEAITAETVRVVATRTTRSGRTRIVQTRHGLVMAAAGVDASNVGPRSGEIVTLLPRDPDASARRIRAAIEERLGVAPGVIVTDSFGRPWRLGITDVAIGVAGISPLEDLRGRPDADGRIMAATVRAVADQIAATAELALGKTARRPLALVRGARPLPAEAGSIRDSLMPADWDLFR